MANGLRGELKDEAMRLYVDASYSSRGHLEEANAWARWAFILGLPLAIVGGLSATGAAATALFTNQKALTAILAFLAAILTSVRGFLRPEESADAHGAKGARYLAIRNAAAFFTRIDVASSAADEDLVRMLRDLRKQYSDLALVPPHLVSSRAYNRAKQSIEQGEATYEGDPLWKQLAGGS